MTEPHTRRPRLAGARGATLVTLLFGGLLAIVASAQPWWRAAGEGATVAFKGTEATGGLSQALAVVTLAGTLLVLVLRVRGRQVVSALLVAAGLGATLVGLLRLRPSSDAVQTKLREVSLIDQYALTPTAWPSIFAVAGVVVVLGGLLLLFGAAQWPRSPDRFERAASTPALIDADDPGAVWKAQDAGLDPTVEAGPGEPDEQPEKGTDPDVHIGAARDTMDEK